MKHKEISKTMFILMTILSFILGMLIRHYLL